MKVKSLFSLLLFSTILSGCFNNVDPLSEKQTRLQEPRTESGFYENIASEVGQKFIENVSDTIFFKYNSEYLTDEAKLIIDSQIKFIQENNIRKIIIEGHSDERGTREYNLALGEKRANSVKKYFVAKGVNPFFIQVISYGKERPLVEAHTESAWEKNRRGVTIVM